MIDRAAIVFCTASVVATLGISAILYPGASMTDAELARSSTPMEMDAFDNVIELGEDFGALTVIELMAHYLENPPAPPGQGAQAEPQREFGGC